MPFLRTLAFMALSGLVPAFSSAATVAASIPSKIAGSDVVKGRSVIVDLKAAPHATAVVFLSARCPCSAGHEQILKDLHREFSKEGFAFVGVHSNSDEGATMTRSHFEKSALPFPVIQDSGARLADAFGALKTPHAYVVAPSGEILFQGGVDDSTQPSRAEKHYLRDALQAVREGRKPDPSRVRALGCVIKR